MCEYMQIGSARSDWWQEESSIQGIDIKKDFSNHIMVICHTSPKKQRKHKQIKQLVPYEQRACMQLLPPKLSLDFCSSRPAPFAGEKVIAQSDSLLGQHLHTEEAAADVQSQNY